MEGVYIVPIDTQALRTKNRPNIVFSKDFYRDCAESNKAEMEDKLSFEMEEFYLGLAPIFCSTTDDCLATNIEIQQDIEISNGKWTNPEMNFINGLISAFKVGDLLLQNGVTLDDFLRSIFLCKSTRLRKKIKNANFCTSTYQLNEQADNHSSSNCLMKLQKEFLESLGDEEKMSLLKFGMGRMLKSHFFNLCLQLGYNNVIHQDWLESLQRIDNKIKAARLSRQLRQRKYQTSLQLSNSTSQEQILGDNPAGYVQFVDYSTRATPPNCFKDSSHASASPSEPSEIPFHWEHWVMPSVVSRENADSPKELSNIIYHNHSCAPKFELHHANYDQKSREREKTHDHLKFDVSEELVRDSLCSIIDKGIRHPPHLVPVEIKDILEDYSASLSDISDSESVDKLPCSDVKDFFPLKKKLKVDDFNNFFSCSKRPIFNAPLESVEHESISSFGLSKVCEKFWDWSPFMKKVSEFIEVEQLPFDYFDVWLVSSTCDVIEQGVSSCSDKTSNIYLRYVGHSPRNNGSIWTLYHMNEFGKHSSKYKFCPGVGLPGKVFASGEPQWYSRIPALSSDTFPRVEAARKHGVQKGLGIPVFHSPLGKIVVAMYTCEDNAIQDGIQQQHVVQKCCNFFQTSNAIRPKVCPWCT